MCSQSQGLCGLSQLLEVMESRPGREGGDMCTCMCTLYRYMYMYMYMYMRKGLGIFLESHEKLAATRD